jgi:hypothetical protein
MRRFLISICIVSVVWCAGAATAATWNVKADGTGDVPTIQAAVDAAGSGDEILVHPGAYTWANQGTGSDYGLITFLRGVGGFTIRSTAGAAATILDAQGQGRVIYLMAYNNVTFEGFTITGGEAPLFGSFDGGGIAAHLCPAVFVECVIRRNNAQNGGGMWCGGVSNMHFIDCEFTDNTAELGAGILFVNSSSSAQLTRCLVAGNTANTRGGGIFVYNNALTLENTIVAKNTAGTLGGAVYMWGGQPATVTNCSMVGNEAVEAGGGVYLIANANLTLINSIVAFSRDGGGIYLDGTSALTVGCTDVYGNYGGDEIPAGAVDNGGNFSADPVFCGTIASFDYTLDAASPCAPGNDPGGGACGLIGALPVACGDVPVQLHTWGSIKALYSE